MRFDQKHEIIMGYISQKTDYDERTHTFAIPIQYPNGDPVRLKYVRTDEALFFTDGGDLVKHLSERLASLPVAARRERAAHVLQRLTKDMPLSVKLLTVRSNVTPFNTEKDLDGEIEIFTRAIKYCLGENANVLSEILEEYRIGDRIQGTINGILNLISECGNDEDKDSLCHTVLERIVTIDHGIPRKKVIEAARKLLWEGGKTLTLPSATQVLYAVNQALASYTEQEYEDYVQTVLCAA